MTVNENTGEKGLPGEKTDEKEIQKKFKRKQTRMIKKDIRMIKKEKKEKKRNPH